MKRCLYPVVKHGARLALIGGLLVPAFCCLMGLLITQDNLIATLRGLMLIFFPETHSEQVSLAIIVAECVVFTLVVAVCEYRRGVRLVDNQTAPRLEADASVPLLAVTDQDDADQASGAARV